MSVPTSALKDLSVSTSHCMLSAHHGLRSRAEGRGGTLGRGRIPVKPRKIRYSSTILSDDAMARRRDASVAIFTPSPLRPLCLGGPPSSSRNLSQSKNRRRNRRGEGYTVYILQTPHPPDPLPWAAHHSPPPAPLFQPLRCGPGNESSWVEKVPDANAVKPVNDFEIDQALGRASSEQGPQVGHVGITTEEASERKLRLSSWGSKYEKCNLRHDRREWPWRLERFQDAFSEKVCISIPRHSHKPVCCDEPDGKEQGIVASLWIRGNGFTSRVDRGGQWPAQGSLSSKRGGESRIASVSFFLESSNVGASRTPTITANPNARHLQAC